MKQLLFLFIIVQCTSTIYAQHTISLFIKKKEDKTPLAGATVTIIPSKKTVFADSSGIASFTAIAAGSYNVTVSFVGFEEQHLSINVPQSSENPVEVLLQESEEHGDEVIVTATRISRTIVNIPTRVEVISGEELDEKGNMKPGDIRMMLNETTGIQAQQTSATSFNSGIRIQGLEGRYTQLLKDGYPLYSGFAGGLSILQIVPLDLK